MSDNTKTINELKNTVLNLKNNPIAKKALGRITKDKEQLLLFYNRNKLKTWIGFVAIISISIYFIVFHNRIDRYLNRMNIYDVDIHPLQYNEEVMNNDYKLCDFYISSSYKSYLPCNNYYDYASCSAISKVLRYGSRYIDLDIYNRDFKPCTEPVVCNGDEIGNWHYTNSVPFNEICRTIALQAFNSTHVSNPNDPLFINLNFKTWNNKLTITKCANYIKKYFQHKLLSKTYAYQGRYTSANIATTSIKELLGKVIIITDGDIRDTLMDEICNLNSSSNSNFRTLTHTQVKDSYDPNELKEFNKKNITRVIPQFPGRKKNNMNFYTPYYLGCQFICMNFTEPTDFMIEYMKRFRSCSFILKPYKLRYQPILIKAPLRQTKKVSFAPKQVTTPFYSITY